MRGEKTNHLTLVLGGARSGKSRFAERLATQSGRPVTYVATSTVTGDADFDERVRQHRERRPSHWETAEPGAGLLEYLGMAPPDRLLLIDSLGTWVTATPDFAVDSQGLCRVLADHIGQAIVVSEEVGLGVHPSTDVGGRFRDALGELNETLSAASDEAWLVIAGRGLRL